MKHFLSTLVLAFLSLSVLAQSPEMFNYQGVARDNGGNVLANQNVGLKFSLLDNDGTTVLYAEDWLATTNDFGLFNVRVGDGTVLSGSLSGISWENGPYFLKVEMDPSGGTSYMNLGTSQLLSVPYALYAESSGNGLPSGSNGSTIRHNGSGWIANTNLYNDGSNVGVGITAPSEKLEVNGNLALSGSARSILAPDGAFNISSASGIDLIVDNDDNSTNSSFRFKRNGDGTETLMTLDENGRLGIGTTSPSELLHVINTENQNAVRIEHQSTSTTSPSRALDFNVQQNDAANTFSVYNRVVSDGFNTGSLYGQYNFMIGDNTVGTTGNVLGVSTNFSSSIVGSGKNLYGYYANFAGTPAANEYSFYANNGNAYFGDNVGIGTTTPSSRLHVKQHSGTYDIGLQFERNADNEHWEIAHASTDNLWFSRNGSLVCWLAPDGSLNTPSDVRLKNSITPLGNVLDKVLKLEATEYFYNFIEDQSQKSIGFIAQEVEKLFPEVVKRDEVADYTVLNYDNFGVIAIKAIQEQQEIIDAQQKQIDQLVEAFEQLQHK